MQRLFAAPFDSAAHEERYAMRHFSIPLEPAIGYTRRPFRFHLVDTGGSRFDGGVYENFTPFVPRRDVRDGMI